MKISVIIPALNEVAQLGGAIASAFAAGADEVLVADGGSIDDTPEVVRRYPRCRWIAAPRGRARQQNAGATVATGDVLLFLHADNRLGGGALRQIRKLQTEHPGKLIAGAFEQRIEAEGRLYRWLEWGNATRVRRGGPAYGDQAIFCSRELFESLGGFPEVPLLEDLLLFQRIRQEISSGQCSAAPIALLPGPVIVNARRWQRRGVIAQTLRNWTILLRYRLGATPEQLAGSYRRHDQ